MVLGLLAVIINLFRGQTVWLSDIWNKNAKIVFKLLIIFVFTRFAVLKNLWSYFSSQTHCIFPSEGDQLTISNLADPLDPFASTSHKNLSSTSTQNISTTGPILKRSDTSLWVDSYASKEAPSNKARKESFPTTKCQPSHYKAAFLSVMEPSKPECRQQSIWPPFLWSREQQNQNQQFWQNHLNEGGCYRF